LFGLQGWAITALSLRRNSTEHNLSLSQVGLQSGSNTGLGCLSGACKEPASTLSMPDPTNSLWARKHIQYARNRELTSSPITHSVYPTTKFAHRARQHIQYARHKLSNRARQHIHYARRHNSHIRSSSATVTLVDAHVHVHMQDCAVVFYPVAQVQLARHSSAQPRMFSRHVQCSPVEHNPPVLWLRANSPVKL
jgi:hypothetical protein